MVQLIQGDNNKVLWDMYNDESIHPDLIYGDCIYEDYASMGSWVQPCYEILKDNGIFMVQTDYHTSAEYKILLDNIFGRENFINWCIYIQEWGGTSKRFFPKKHDDILIYAKGKDYKFYYDRIMIPKATAGTKFDKRGDGLKIPCDVFYDLGNFSTMSKERIKDSTGKNIKWQKPYKLMDRLLLPFTDEGDLILDPYLGSGSTGEWCLENNRDFIGIEIDTETYNIAKERIDEWQKKRKTLIS